MTLQFHKPKIFTKGKFMYHTKYHLNFKHYPEVQQGLLFSKYFFYALINQQSFRFILIKSQIS